MGPRQPKVGDLQLGPLQHAVCRFDITMADVCFRMKICQTITKLEGEWQCGFDSERTVFELVLEITIRNVLQNQTRQPLDSLQPECRHDIGVWAKRHPYQSLTFESISVSVAPEVTCLKRFESIRNCPRYVFNNIDDPQTALVDLLDQPRISSDLAC